MALEEGLNRLPAAMEKMRVDNERATADAAAARQILSDNKRNSIDIDWDDFEGLADEEVQDAYRQMPITARIAFFCVVLALISFVLLVILNL